MTGASEESKGFRLLAHTDLGGNGDIGEGMAIQQLPGGRRILWLAHVNAPNDFSALDVTDPRQPKVVFHSKLPHDQVRTNTLALVGDVLMVGREAKQKGGTPAGVAIFDVSRPETPKEITFFDLSGPSSTGPHMVWWLDGKYAHMSTGSRDFIPANPKDEKQYMIVEMSDPPHPREVGRWWMPGTRQGDEAPPPQRHQGVPDRGYRIHNVNAYPQRPDRAYLGYMDGGAVILDTSNLGRMHMISQWDYHPPFEGMTHTVMPLFDRDLLIVCEERARAGDPDEQPMYMWVVDVREEPRPQSISICPPPNPADYGKRPGWYGPHNIFENDTLPTAWFSDKFIFAAMFNAGLRVYDISNPFRPEEVAYYVPPAPEGADSIRINDVYVDEKGLVYAADRVKGGIYILEMQF